MKSRYKYPIFILLLIGFVSCLGSRNSISNVYFGNFQENRLGFFESFGHITDKEHYCKLPFELKFGGISPFPSDTLGKKDYSWLRNPQNLTLAFNTFKSVGLEKFVSKEQYNKPNTDWCCNTQWENKSLNEIVKSFIGSYADSSSGSYYSKFWQRRKREGNVVETYNIFVKIDQVYNGAEINVQEMPYDPVLQSLLNYDLQLLNADSAIYSAKTIQYFNYLKVQKLDYSAYKIIFDNPRLNISNQIKDSIRKTIQYDTLTYEEWNNWNSNFDSWISSENYPDPNVYDGP